MSAGGLDWSSLLQAVVQVPPDQVGNVYLRVSVQYAKRVLLGSCLAYDFSIGDPLTR